MNREVDCIEILMKRLFDFLSTLGFCPRLLNVRIARESLLEYQCLFVRRLILSFSSDQELKAWCEACGSLRLLLENG